MLPALSGLMGLFGGGGAGPAAAPDEITQTVTLGPISFGSRYMGRGSVSASDTTASGGASVTAAAPDRSGLYLAAGLAFVALLLVVRKGGA